MDEIDDSYNFHVKKDDDYVAMVRLIKIFFYTLKNPLSALLRA